MAQVTLYAEKYAYVERGGAGDSHSNSLQPIESTLDDPHFLLRFPALPSSYQYRIIKAITLRLGVNARYYPEIRSEKLEASDFNAASVTYSTIPNDADALDLNTGIKIQSHSLSDNVVGTVFFDRDMAVSPREILTKRTWVLYRFLLNYYVQSGTQLSLYTPSAAQNMRPHLVVDLEDEDEGVNAGSVSIGYPTYLNPHKAYTFHFGFTINENLTLQPISVTQEKFFWRETGASSWNEISLTPGARELTIPAETFPAATSVEYYLQITCNSGVTDESLVYTSSTADSAAVATPESPVSTVEAATEPISFAWSAFNPSGSVPTGFDIQFSADGGTSWSEAIHINSSTGRYTASANTFSAGTINWRVRAYNIDNVAGSWKSASFVALAAPPAPAVQSDAAPFATITWQSSGQQAYQIEIDGKDLGVFFGETLVYKLQTPLSDGNHEARVRVQNSFGLWSPYGSAVFYVSNVPGDSIELMGSFGSDAALSWATGAAVADFLIFRDEALIGHTVGNSFVDRFVLGEHSYTVINRLPSGNYSRSNVVTGRMCVCRPMAAAFDGGEWIPLKYSEKSMAEQRFTWSRTHSLRHIAGTKYPVLELSPFEDLSGTYDAAFPSACCAEAFRALRGKVVIIKSREGKVVIGALVNVSEVVNSFYLSMQFTIEQIAWEDFVDDQDS